MKTIAFLTILFTACAPLLAEESLPAPWKSQDVGPVKLPGKAEYANGAFVLQGTMDTWGKADGCEFVSQPLKGDFEIVARAVSMENPGGIGHAKASVAFRESLDPGAKRIIMAITAVDGTQFLYRPETDSITTRIYANPEALKTMVPKGHYPCWLKLVRKGKQFTGYESADGEKWVVSAQIELDLAQEGLIGLAATSHRPDVYVKATFDNVKLTVGGEKAVLSAAEGKTAESQSSIWTPSNVTAWCVVPFDAKARGPVERAEMFQRLGIKHFAYDWRASQIPTFDAEIEAMTSHGIEISAWYYPSDPNDKNAKLCLEAFKRHRIHPQLWIMHAPKSIKMPEEQDTRVEAEADRVQKIIEMARPYGCPVELYNHNGWFGQTDNEIAIIEKLKERGIKDVGTVYNFSHGHGDIDDFPVIWKRMKPYVVAVNVSGVTRSEKLIPPSQGEHELAMMRVIQESGWHGPVGLIAEQGGDAEITLRNGLRGLAWLGDELRKPGSGRERPAMEDASIPASKRAAP